MSPEPEVWKYEKYHSNKTASVTRFAPKKPSEWIDTLDISIVPDSVEPCFSAETIQEEIDEIIDGIKSEIMRLKEGEHELEAFQNPDIAILHHELQLENFQYLKQRFSESDSNQNGDSTD